MYPTEEEFSDPYTYIKSLLPLGEKYGILKIEPPAKWRPKFSLDLGVSVLCEADASASATKKKAVDATNTRLSNSTAVSRLSTQWALLLEQLWIGSLGWPDFMPSGALLWTSTRL